MEDKELLIAAAKAAGMVVQRSRLDDPLHHDFLMDGQGVRNPGQRSHPWNPLTDDGDALRLAVKLHIEFVVDSFDARVSYMPTGQHPMAEGFAEIYEDASADPYAATRRAIVRAAAALAPQGVPEHG